MDSGCIPALLSTHNLFTFNCYPCFISLKNYSFHLKELTQNEGFLLFYVIPGSNCIVRYRFMQIEITIKPGIIRYVRRRRSQTYMFHVQFMKFYIYMHAMLVDVQFGV